MSEKLLNEEQKKAINFGDGPLLIIAGAGTGKTTVITERLRFLVIEKGLKPSEILALTFTEKASFEMQERIDVLLPYGYTNLWIHTFHAFCDRIMRDEAHQIGLDSNYKQISDSESVLLLRQNIFELGLNIFRPLGNPTKFIEALLSHFSRLKDEDITPTEYLKWALKQKSDDSKQYLELANAYKGYEELKIKYSLMDFSDLISNVLLLFRKRPEILNRYQNQFKYVLVDEFQDTNFAQNELAILLSGDDKNITVVADDDQSIYRFRGAAVSNVLQFKKNFPRAVNITLNQNYRSTQAILDASYRLIQNNNPNRLEVVEKIDKKLKSNKSDNNEKIELIHQIKSEDEADEIAKTIQKITKKKYNYKDIAILVRANNHAAPITQALQRRGVPYQFLGPSYLFNQDEIKDLIAYLNFLTNPSDSVSLFRVLSMDIFKIPYVEIIYLFNYAKKKNLNLFQSLDSIDQSFLKTDSQEKLKKFKEMILRHLERSKKDSAGQVLYYFIADSGLFESLQKAESVIEERRVQNIAKFFDRIKNFETDRPDSNVFTVTEWLNLMLQMGDSPTAADVDMKDRDAVNILTVHSSKGLEFEVVFLINLVSDRFPSRERSEKIPLPEGIIKEKLPTDIDFHLEEERRLFYVGMTRAREKLYFTAADYYGTGKRTKKISPFVYEATPDLKTSQKSQIRSEQLSLTEVLAPYHEHEEIKEKKQPLKIDYITYSNLQMFDICPLHYKAKVIFNIPTPVSSVQSFGISIHNALYKFYKAHQENVNLNLEYLLNLLHEEWINEGYLNKKHEEERFEEAKKALTRYFEKEFKKEVTPIGLELPINFALKNGVKVFGKIDRIDKTQDGIEIIDYKTGQDNPKADSAHRLQLAIYALAATKIKDPLLNRKPEDITLSLHFLESNSKKTMQFTKEDLDSLEEELINKIHDIEKSDFHCSKNVLCVNCEYKMLCST